MSQPKLRNNHKLRAAFGLEPEKERIIHRKRGMLGATLPPEDVSALDYIGSSFPNVMKDAPEQTTYAQKVMGYPETHRQARCGESEEWSFDRPA